MRSLFFVALGAWTAWFGWKRFKEDKPRPTAPIAAPDKTTGADATNRVDTRSGFVADP